MKVYGLTLTHFKARRSERTHDRAPMHLGRRARVVRVICLACHAPTTNGLALCDLCQRKVSTDLEYLPIYFRNLARWRPPARPNGSLGISGQWLLRKGEGETSNITNTLDHASNDLTTWARMLTDDRGIELPSGDDETQTFELVCEAMTGHLTSIATLEWCGEFVNAIGIYEYSLRTLTETCVPGWYAGECRRCKSPTYVVPGLTWVTCRGCGVSSYARDHLETIVDEARGWVARPMRLAEAIVALVDTEMSVPRLHKRISKWGERERIEAVRSSSYAPKRYRFGDVLALLLSEGETRSDEDLDTKAG